MGLSSLKNASCRNVEKTLRGVKKGEWYMAKDYKHTRNENNYACKGRDWCYNGVVGAKCKNII
jgi:hypothetical protein